jgi:threonine dehydrogenase-like Zn-dependent dehydrogenase
MRAAILYKPNIISVEVIPFDPSFSLANANHEYNVVLKVNACAVCGYDVRVFRWTS